MRELRLELPADGFTDVTRWRWVLTDADSGELLAGHEVRLDAGAWQFDAYSDLSEYLLWHTAPDRRNADEARIVTMVGEWIGAEVLGPVGDALVAAGPTTVRVAVPAEAQELLFRPLELGRVNGRPLALQDVTLVMQPGTAPSETGHGVGQPRDRLRVLGLFSLPDGAHPLSLRRERQELVSLIRGIDAGGKAAEVRVLQYGVTRDRLRDVLEQGGGWDIIHISGHGRPGELLLETAAGEPDRLTTVDLADLLDVARDRVELVTVSACWSAARTVGEPRRLLGLPVPDEGQPGNSGGSPARGGVVAGTRGAAAGALATELAERLGCAVLAMRYPVADEFAIALTGKLYELLAAQGQPLPQAIGMALKQVAAVTRLPPLSVATPALFGHRVSGLTLAAPSRREGDDYDTAARKLAGFPPAPDRLVGRTGVLARASTALAAGSGVPGVVLHGMPGGGKTACALELAYTHEDSFDQLIWYQAPAEGHDIIGALTDFALALERQLPGFQIVHALADDAALVPFLPELAELAGRRVLIVIDNAETLLTAEGLWRDKRWGQVIAALTSIRGAGRGRLVLTSRRMPANTSGLQPMAVDALSADEALLLARELPHLRKLIYGPLPAVAPDVRQRLARGVLDIAQGHPKMLELADGQAADPERLAALVDAGDQAWQEVGGLPEGFFAGRSAANGPATTRGDDYLHVLAAWTRTATATLSPGERAVFWFLCCLEEPDRDWFALRVLGAWPGLWQRLGQEAPAQGLDEALGVIASRGLISARAGGSADDRACMVHPGVAATGRAQAGQVFRNAVDTLAALAWDRLHSGASGKNSLGIVMTNDQVRAGLSAVPYLIRMKEWSKAATLLQNAFDRDPSRANASTLLPAMQRIAAHDRRQTFVLARILEELDPATSEQQAQAALTAAVSRGDYETGAFVAGRLLGLCRESGRLAEALALADRRADYTIRAGLGPWTQLHDQAKRLEILNVMGRAGEVFAEAERLRARMDLLPAFGSHEVVAEWMVRETLLGASGDAALLLGRWDDVLSFNGEVIASMRRRDAPAFVIAARRFNDHWPLLRLGRVGEALDLLRDCLQTFQDRREIRLIGYTLAALAAVETERGHGEEAIRLERDALRYLYQAENVRGIATSYHNLGSHLHNHSRQPATAFACHLAAALIESLSAGDIDNQNVKDVIRDGAMELLVFHHGTIDLRAFGEDNIPPPDMASLCRLLADIAGTDLAALIGRLAPTPQAAESALRDLVELAQIVARLMREKLLKQQQEPTEREGGRKRVGR